MTLRVKESENWFFTGAPKYFVETIGFVSIGLVSYFMVSSNFKNDNALPLIGAIAYGAQKLLPAMQMIYAHWANMKSVTQSIKNVTEMLDQKIPKKNTLQFTKTYNFKKEICFKNVSFKYDSKENFILNNLNFTFYPGERIGITGSSGSGKTTFINILMGLIEPSSGFLLIDNKDIFNPKNIKYLSQWQASISHVQQNVFLNDSSIAENIALGTEIKFIDKNRLIESAKKARIHDFIINLPNKYSTLVGERGIRLSGGQKQRFGLARALYKNSNTLIFDEPTSALDLKTEKEILDTFRHIDDEKIIFLISHKKSTLSICDRIIEIKI